MRDISVFVPNNCLDFLNALGVSLGIRCVMVHFITQFKDQGSMQAQNRKKKLSSFMCLFLWNFIFLVY